MKLCAIPTVYRGTRFRSRLEARWAAFFDLVGWRWSYEPVDLPGYIPDFVLHGDSPCLVEIKPSVADDDWDVETESAVAAKAGSLDVPLLLLGSVPLSGRSGIYPTLGSILLPRREAWDAAFLFTFGTGREALIGNTWTSVHRAVPNRLPPGFHPSPADPSFIARAWSEASNATQWKGTP